MSTLSDPTAIAPRLVPIANDESRFALTLIGQTDPNGPLRFWHTALSPWSAPNGTSADLATTFLYHLESPAYAVAPSAIEDAYGLLVGVSQPPGVTFDPAVTPGASEPGTELPFPAQNPGSLRPLFVARRPKSTSSGWEHLLGYEQRMGERRRLLVRIVSTAWGAVEHMQAAACANRPIAASGAGINNAFFIAAATSRELGKCDDPADAFDDPTRLTVLFYNLPLGVVLNSMAEWQEPTPIEEVELVVGEGALWVVYTTRLSETQARLRFARVGLTGGVLAGPFDVADVPRPALLSAARLGSRLAIASRERTAEGQTIVPVRIFEASGAPEQDFTVVPHAAEGVAIAGEPNGHRLLVAITEGKDGASGPVVVGRYGCE